MPKKPTPAPAVARQRVPLGVYINDERYTAIAIKRSTDGIWFLTMHKGSVTLEHSGDERFQHDFPLVLADYPILRALRKYESSGLSRDERTQTVMRQLIEGLSQ